MSSGGSAIEERGPRDVSGPRSFDDLRGFLDRLPDGVFRFRMRPRPCFELVNRTLAWRTGTTVASFFANPRQLVDLAHPIDAAALGVLFERGPQPMPVTARLRTRRGTYAWVEIRATPVSHATVFEAILRWLVGPAALRPPTILVGDLRIEAERGRVIVGDSTVHLTPSELRVLVFLTQRPGEVVTREEIVGDLWQTTHPGDGGVAETHISALRRKIERDPRRPTRILTVRGRGYRFVP